MQTARVELRAARVPIVGRIAHHCWLVADDASGVARWEVWQWRDAGGESWGHLHRNLLPPDSGVGNGPSWVVHAWRGTSAAALIRGLEQAPERYPWRYRYLPWPGPNSNTFVRWVVGDPGVMGWQALGKHFPFWRHSPARTARRPSPPDPG